MEEVSQQTPKELTNSKRKKELLRKTAIIFAEKGYQACTVQEIAQALSISKGGLYWHFKSKEELYFQVCDSYCISSISAIRDMLNQPELNFVDFKLGFAQLLNGYLSDGIQIDLIIDFYAEAKRSEFIHEKLLEMMEQREAVLIALINRLIEEKTIKKIDAKWVAGALVSTLMGLLFKFSLHKNSESVKGEFQGFFDLFFQKEQ